MELLGTTLSVFFGAVGRADAQATAPEAAANIVRLQRRLRLAARQLAAIEPPAAIAADHERLIDGVRTYAKELDGIIGRLRAGDKQALATIPHLQGIEEMTAASQAITRGGFDITGSGPPASG